ncbi:MAG TPA: hypothetical protein VHE35_25365 [Kofleriaceae bacterium]|nr:hypothetical protein [Kofleriaceae bacterium]
MFSRDSRINFALSLMFLVLSACGGLGNGCGCTSQPLPAGGLPKDQTIEGGGQIRVTRPGFQKLTQIIPAVLNDSLSNGFCVGGGSVGTPSGGFLATGARYCSTNQGGTPQIPDACGNSNGCNVGVHVDSVNVSVTNAQRLNVRVQLDVYSSVPLSGQVVGIGFSCTLNANGDNIVLDADIDLGIRPDNGELTVNLHGINGLDTSDLSFSGCSVVSDVANLLNDLLNSFIGSFIVDLLEPTFNNLIQGFLPNPLGIAGMVDIGQLMSGVSPGTEGEMEARMVPGGYVQMQGNGLSLGLITGLNADQNPLTRTPDLDSEPAYCVPPIPAPNFAAPPASLPTSPRGTFILAPAGEFSGNPDPADDLAIGMSETTLDLAGHHLVTSGGLCLGVGTSLINQLKLGTIGLLVPSLGELGKGDEPVLLVTRPQQAIDFAIGDNTMDSPALTMTLTNFEVDFYGFIYERYTRAFTMSLNLKVGINLEFSQMPGQAAQVKPILVGLDSSNIQIHVLNSEFVAETPQQLETVLPTVFDLALPLIGQGLQPIDVPSFAGFTLNNLRVQHVTTAQDDFLAIYASLGASQMMKQLAHDKYPSLQPVLDRMDPTPQWPAIVQDAHARLHSVDVPPPVVVRGALMGIPGDSLPTVTIDVDHEDAQGRELEWSWNLNGGLWRPFTSASPLVLRDRAFAWQGKYKIGLQARVKGDYRTTSPDTLEIPVVIDSSAPKIDTDSATWTGDLFVVPATDAVYDHAELEWAWGSPSDTEAATDWSHSSAADRQTAKDLSVDGDLRVFVRDPSGNIATAIAKSGLTSFHGAPGEGGCTCDSRRGPSSGGVVVMLLTAFALLLRGRGRRLVRVAARHRRLVQTLAIWVGLSLATALVPGCDCGSKPGADSCEVDMDCADFACNPGEISICFEGTCTCIDDVPYGRIGPHSDVAVAPNGDAVVSAYAENHGDLVVARHAGAGRIPDSEWEFVDGVPDGPVVVPGSKVRGGIMDPGPDVGLYTSVGVAPDDSIMVSYYDRDNGSLKFAGKYQGTWSTHVIDAGTGPIVDPEIGGVRTGLYTSMTVRTDDGRPGIAYLAETSQGGGIVTGEVRFALANVPNPKQTSDWTVTTVDTMTLPAPDPNNPDIYPLPSGIGLFIEAALDANNAPSVVYYDRQHGDLKLVRYDMASGRFGAPVVLDGQNGDAGWYPSVAVDPAGVANVAYQSADHDDVMFISTAQGARPELVDDGYRLVGTTADGLPKPEFHFVGNDTQIVNSPAGPMIIYQDSTSHELLVATKVADTWTHDTIAGDEDPFVGAYGFYASAAPSATEAVVSTWVIDQPEGQNWVEIFRLPIAAGRVLH